MDSTPDEAMVEAVGRAISRSIGIPDKVWDYTINQMACDSYRDSARAAIAAVLAWQEGRR